MPNRNAESAESFREGTINPALEKMISAAVADALANLLKTPGGITQADLRNHIDLNANANVMVSADETPVIAKGYKTYFDRQQELPTVTKSFVQKAPGGMGRQQSHPLPKGSDGITEMLDEASKAAHHDPHNDYKRRNRNAASNTPAPTQTETNKAAQQQIGGQRAMCKRWHSNGQFSKGRASCSYCLGQGFEQAERAREASNHSRNLQFGDDPAARTTNS